MESLKNKPSNGDLQDHPAKHLEVTVCVCGPFNFHVPIGTKML